MSSIPPRRSEGAGVGAASAARSADDGAGGGGRRRPGLPRVPRSRHYSDEAVRARLDWLHRTTGAALPAVAAHGLALDSLAGNIENVIGAVRIPVGIAGPLELIGADGPMAVPVPIATTEGALVASITRGAAVCNAAGGIRVHVVRRTMVRAPVFFCRDLDGALALEAWIGERLAAIRAEAESVSSVARLQEVRTHVFDDTLHVQFYFATGDAAGQNMTTACTWMACRWIADAVAGDPTIGLRRYMVEGNLSGDKKASFQNFSLGRGTAVTASCRIPGALLRARMRLTPAEFVRGWQSGEVGSLQAGMQGSNINFANVVAGVFAATGQDVACVHESAAGYLKAREDDGDLVLSAYLPALVVGTVGGGTQLPTQRECLAVMGCAGPGKARRLAEIIAAGCLALDLSTGSAIIANEFVRAHESLGRNRPQRRLRRQDLDASLLSGLLHDRRERVTALWERPLDTGDSILTRAAAEGGDAVWGLYRYRLRIEGPAGPREQPAVLKLKAPGSRLLEVASQVARLTGDDRLGGLFESQGGVFGLEHCHLREVAVYRHAREALAAHIPAILGTASDPARDFYAILMEDLGEAPADDWALHGWDAGRLGRALDTLADLHGAFWQRPDALADLPAAGPPEPADYRRAAELLAALTAFNAGRYPQLLTPALAQRLSAWLADPGALVQRLGDYPMTLTHNDFSPRNIAWRGDRPVVYDWELACFQNPHHDVAELLAFVLPPGSGPEAFLAHGEAYRRSLQTRLGQSLDPRAFREALHLNAVELLLVRFNLYLMGHNLLRFRFLDRAYGNLARFVLGADGDRPGGG